MIVALKIGATPVISAKGRPQQSSQPQYHALVNEWASRVVANGGNEPSSQTKQALNTFCNGLQSSGLLSKMLMVNPVVPDNLTAALTPLIYTQGGVTPTELCNGSFDNLTGWASNGATRNIVSGGVSGTCLQMTHYPGTNAYTYWTLSAGVNKRYRVRLWFKKFGGRGQVRIGTAVNGADIYNGPFYNDDNWSRKLIHFTATAGTIYVTLSNVDQGSAGTMWDEVSITEVACDEIFTNVNFTSGDLNVNGLKGNGSSKYLVTGLPAGLLPFQNASTGIFITEAPTISSYPYPYDLSYTGDDRLVLMPVRTGATLGGALFGPVVISYNPTYLPRFLGVTNLNGDVYLYVATPQLPWSVFGPYTGYNQTLQPAVSIVLFSKRDGIDLMSDSRQACVFVAKAAFTNSEMQTIKSLISDLRVGFGGNGV